MKIDDETLERAMNRVFDCPNCGTSMKDPIEFAGALIWDCSRCGASLEIDQDMVRSA